MSLLNYIIDLFLIDDTNKQAEIVVSFNQLKNLIVRELPDVNTLTSKLSYKAFQLKLFHL